MITRMERIIPIVKLSLRLQYQSRGYAIIVTHILVKGTITNANTAAADAN